MNADTSMTTQLALVDSDSPARHLASTPIGGANSNEETHGRLSRSANSFTPGNASLVIRGANSDPWNEGTQAIHATNKPRVLDDIISEVRLYDDSLRSSPFPISQVRVEQSRLIADDEEFALNDAGFRRIYEQINAPAGYLGRLDPELRSRNVEYGFQTMGAQPTGLKDANSTILYRDGEFVGFGRKDLYTLQGTEALNALRDGLGDDALQGLYVQNFQLRDEVLSIDVVSSRLRTEVRPGDIVEAGIHLEHSLLGEQATLVTVFVVRLACSNGMTHRECVGARRTRRTRRLDSKRDNARELQYQQVRSLVASTRARLEEKLEAIRKLESERFHAVSEVDKIIEHFLRKSRLYSANLMQQLRRAWTEPLGGNRELTYFAVLNALTWLATHSDQLDPKERPSERQLRALSALAGVFAYHRVHICPSCFSVLAGHDQVVAG